MAQYTLTEQEVRTLAFKYANETMEHPASYYVCDINRTLIFKNLHTIVQVNILPAQAA